MVHLRLDACLTELSPDLGQILIGTAKAKDSNSHAPISRLRKIAALCHCPRQGVKFPATPEEHREENLRFDAGLAGSVAAAGSGRGASRGPCADRSEEHTSELQSPTNL